MSGVGSPEVVTVKVKDVPAWTVSDAALVKAGAVPVVDADTVSVKGWDAAGLTPLEASMVKVKVPAATDEVPTSVAVPSPLSFSVTPSGSEEPESREMAGVGLPVVVTVKWKGAPAVAVSDATLVKAGDVDVVDADTVSVNGWDAAGLTPLAASMVNV
jgi:hypothetical protein